MDELLIADRLLLNLEEINAMRKAPSGAGGWDRTHEVGRSFAVPPQI